MQKQNSILEKNLAERLYQDAQELPVIKAEKTKKTKKRKLEALSDDEQQDLLLAAQQNNMKHYIVLRLLLETGIRAAELCNILIENSDLSTGRLSIRNIQSKKYTDWTVKTFSSERDVFVSKELIVLLKTLINKRKNGYLIESRKGGSYSPESITRIVNQYAKKSVIGRNIGAHALRRTFATNCLRDRLPLSSISQALGHSSIRTTFKYLKRVKDRQALIEIQKTTENRFKKMNLEEN